jgi:monothiol glutaredoxin
MLETRYAPIQTQVPMSQTSPKIVIYTKTFCGWSEGVRATMRKYKLKFEEKDIIKNPSLRLEMEQRSGQALAPCIEIDGHMLVGLGGEEMEKWLIQNEYVRKNEAVVEQPISSPRIEVPARIKEAAKPRLPANKGKVRFFD